MAEEYGLLILEQRPGKIKGPLDLKGYLGARGGVLLSECRLKLKFLKVTDRRAEFHSEKEGASLQCCPVWLGRAAYAGTFCHSLNEPASLWDPFTIFFLT